jgi:SAM-dependent methyltransferase
MHKLFETFAHRYDLHTPPDHYQHDHQLVLDLAREHGPACRILDIGCGTGVLVAKALEAGFDAYGVDASESMIAAASRRVPSDRLRVQRMQGLDDIARYDFIVSTSWSIHYCSGERELLDILMRARCALASVGRLLLQVAHGPNLREEWCEDREPGPEGVPDDISLRYRFSRDEAFPGRLNAEYVYRCKSTGEAMEESHVLEAADAMIVARTARSAGFDDVQTWNSWRRDALSSSGSVWVTATDRLTRPTPP